MKPASPIPTKRQAQDHQIRARKSISLAPSRCAAHGCTRLAGGLDRVFCSGTCRGRGRG